MEDEQNNKCRKLPTLTHLKLCKFLLELMGRNNKLTIDISPKPDLRSSIASRQSGSRR